MPRPLALPLPLKRWPASGLALPLALLPAPSLALEVTPTGQVFSDYSVDLKETLTPGRPVSQTFGVRRARIGVKAVNGPVTGFVQTDVVDPTSESIALVLKHAWAEADTGFGRLRGGQFSTGWTVPVEEAWYPFRYQGKNFTTRESLFPTEDRGLSWAGDLGPVALNVGVFNGEGDSGWERDANSFPKAYEATVRIKALEKGEVAFHGRYKDAPIGVLTEGAALAGINADFGRVDVGLEGGIKTNQWGVGATATSSLGFGGSAFAYAPDLMPIPLLETPVVRADFAGDNFSGIPASPLAPPSNRPAHYRLLGGLAHTWAPGAQTMLSYEIEQDLKGTQLAQSVGWRGGFRF